MIGQPDKRRGGPSAAPRIQPPPSRRITYQGTAPRKQPCPCGRWWCPDRVAERHALMTRPDVVHATPSDWEGMVACGFNPLDGTPITHGGVA
jgi:hypothetical protein